MEQSLVTYDYIFAGFGLSACHVLLALLDDGSLEHKKILILDNPAERVEKSWCFWEKGAGKWDNILSKSWKKGLFLSDGLTLECLKDRFIYKYLASGDFIGYTYDRIKNLPLVTILDEPMLSWKDDGNIVSVQTKSGAYKATMVFSSASDSAASGQKYPVLLQHFTGWFIESDQKPFPADTMTIMDFSVDQNNHTRFLYVLPFSETTALVEYTLFSPELLEADEYESELKKYLQAKGITQYTITKKEKGVIPMTSQPFWKANTKNVLHIGTAGGWTKPSTGYTFTRAEKIAKRIPKFIISGNRDFRKFHKSDRFDFYDRIFIEVLYYRNELGKQIFSSIFKNAGPETVLSFMKEETTLIQELRIILACPKLPFIKALWKTCRF